MYRKKQGFTLVELMMVMGIIALIIALGVPIYSAMAMNRSLGGSAELVSGAFLKYRSKATASGKPVFLIFEHWHMDPDLAEGSDADWSKLTPPKLQAFMVEPNEEAEAKWDIYEIDDPIQLPKRTWFNESWVVQLGGSGSDTFSEENVKYGSRVKEIYDSYYDVEGLPSSWAKGHFFAIVFLPSGHLEIVGKDNVPGFDIEDNNDPDGDIWMTNGEDTILIDINPSTGRTMKARYSNADFEKFGETQ